MITVTLNKSTGRWEVKKNGKVVYSHTSVEMANREAQGIADDMRWCASNRD
jgi:hypothetical protein